jgi:chemotaxis protein CheX
VNQPQVEAIVNLAPQVHPQAFHSRTGQGTRDPTLGKEMNTTNPAGTAPANAFQEWQPLLELAAREVFELMLNCKLQSGGEVQSSSGEITAMVGLAGQLCGLVSVRCTLKSAASMASRMLGAEIRQGDKQMFDAVGEMSNMVAGNFKNKLTGIADKCMVSVPTVITGSEYSCHSMADIPPLQVMFSFEGALVTVALEIHS